MPDKSRKPFNPFYPMLVIAGVIFCVTACAYGVMTVRKLRNPLEENPPQFIQWMDESGFSLMMWELGALALLTFAAMAADSYLLKHESPSQTRAADLSNKPPKPETPGNLGGQEDNHDNHDNPV